MKVTLVSDIVAGGAAIDVRRLREGLACRNACAVTWVAAAGKSDPCVVTADEWPALVWVFVYRFFMLLRVPAILLARIRYLLHEQSLLRVVNAQHADIINLHNLHANMTFAFAEKAGARSPLVWTLHDMWPLTGYCKMSYDCTLYESGCRDGCQQAGKWGQGRFSTGREWRRRSRFFSKNHNRLRMVAPSQWLASCAEKRVGPYGVRVNHIPYGLDLDVFRPIHERAVIRKILGLPEHAIIFLTCSTRGDTSRKGISYLREAQQRLTVSGQRCVVVNLGERPEAGRDGEEWRYTGYIQDEALLNLYYNAADFFILPTLADNFPNTLLESLAAGTPCVTYDTGGCPEIVRDGLSGFVAKYADIDDLARCLLQAIALPEKEYRTMSNNCRSQAEKEYGLELQARRYEALFADLIAQQNKKTS